MIKNPWIEALLITAFLGIYTLTALIGISAHKSLTEMDTVPYLKGALQIRETGGVTSHIANCFSGVYTEATQHPLYLLLLSPWAERSFDFFVQAKKVTAIIGFLFCIVFYAMVRKLKGATTALVATLLLLFSATFTHMSTMVACEALFSLFFVLFILFYTLGVKNENYWYAAGAAASLAFLSKSLGILCIGIFVLSSLWMFRKNISSLLKRKSFWGFFAAFIVLALPLFARNIKVYGSPLYSDSSCVLWLDRWHDYLRPDIATHPPTLASYWKQHGLGGFAKILFEGILIRDPKMIVDGLKPFPFWTHPIDTSKLAGFNQITAPWQAWWAGFLCVTAGLSLWKNRKEPLGIVCVVSLVVFLVFVGWYSKIFPNETPTRLLYPILFLILLSAADFFSIVSEKYRRLAVSVIIVVFAVCLGVNFEWSKLDISKSYRMNTFAATQILWAAKNAPTDKTVLLGYEAAAHTFYFPKIKSRVVSWPTLTTMPEMEAFLRENSIRHAVLDVAAVLYNLKLFGAYFIMGPETGLISRKPLPAFFKEIPSDAAPAKYMRFYEIT